MCTPFKLLGKAVFLFLNSFKCGTYQIENFVKYHGGHILNFLDKHVDIVIMDMTLRRKTPRLKLPSTKFTRSQQLIDKTTKKSGSFSIELFAAKWSIQIIDHKEILHYCNTDLHREDMSVGLTIKKLQVPFIKVEDQSRKYRPEFVEFKCFPFMDTTVPMPCSPFDTWFKLNSTGNKDFNDENGDQQNRQYFCELCSKNYVEIQSHLGTAEHKHAAMDDASYAGVDALIKKGASVEDFLKMIREKHSVRSCDNE